MARQLLRATTTNQDLNPMGRPTGVSGADTMRAIRKAAISRIYRHGFEAMNLRDLAADVNLRLGSLYNHVPQKQEFLANLLEEIMRELLQDLHLRMGGLTDPQQRLLRFVRFHIEWHTVRKEETFVGNMEQRSLNEEQRARFVAQRKEYEAHLRNILIDGEKAGLWRLDDVLLRGYRGMCENPQRKQNRTPQPIPHRGSVGSVPMGEMVARPNIWARSPGKNSRAKRNASNS
jgi:AcrR family transcriptional regulator